VTPKQAGGTVTTPGHEHPEFASRKVVRVGYFVTVDVDAFDEREAGVVGEVACGWPGDWMPAHEPIPVEGVLNEHRVTARIVRTQALMVKEQESWEAP